MYEDQHADRRDEKRRKQRDFVEDNRRSVREIARLRKFNKPQRGGVREWNPEEASVND